MNALNQLIARRTQILTRITLPRQHVTTEQLNDLDLDNTHLNNLEIRIAKLRKVRTEQLQEAAMIKTKFRNKIADAPFIEVNNVDGAIYMTRLYMRIWNGTICINTNLCPELKHQIATNSVGIRRRLFDWAVLRFSLHSNSSNRNEVLWCWY